MKNGGIQALRGIAASFVVLHHVDVLVRKPKYFNETILHGFFQNGFRGVDLFFVISGFIMMGTIISEPQKTFQSFILQRLKRIFIPYLPFFFGLTLIYLLIPAVRQSQIELNFYYFVMNAFLLPRLQLETYVPVVAWTLTYELTFYFIFSLGLTFNNRFLLPIIGVWMLLCIGNIFVGLPYMFLDILNLGFGIGIVAQILSKYVLTQYRPYIFWGSSMVFVALLSYPAGRDFSPVLNLAFLFLSGLLCLSVSSNIRNPLTFVGDYSYSLYLCHYPILASLFILAFRVGIGQNLGIYGITVLSVAVALTISYAYYLVFEVKVYRYFSKKPMITN